MVNRLLTSHYSPLNKQWASSSLQNYIRITWLWLNLALCISITESSRSLFVAFLWYRVFWFLPKPAMTPSCREKRVKIPCNKLIYLFRNSPKGVEIHLPPFLHTYTTKVLKSWKRVHFLKNSHYLLFFPWPAIWILVNLCNNINLKWVKVSFDYEYEGGSLDTVYFIFRRLAIYEEAEDWWCTKAADYRSYCCFSLWPRRQKPGQRWAIARRASLPVLCHRLRNHISSSYAKQAKLPNLPMLTCPISA